MTRRAFVLGGGVSGLSAALSMRDRGFDVTLLESRGWLGGRAFSFVDRVTGGRLDNGPHVMLGCYRSMRGLLRRLGTEDGFEQSRALRVAYRRSDASTFELRLGGLPPALSMPGWLLRAPMTVGERLRVLRGMLGVGIGAPRGWTLAEWIGRRGQTGAPAQILWEPLCRAIMNVEPEDACARLFLATLREAFSGTAASAAIWVPKRPWSELIGDAAVSALTAAGVDLRLSTRVNRLAANSSRVRSLQLNTDKVMEVGAQDVVVSALPWHALARLLDQRPPFAGLRSSPIVSVHFETARDEDAPADDGPVTAFVGGEPFHFLCRTPGGPRRRFAVLAGGADALGGRSVAEIEDQARRQLQRFCGWRVDTPAAVRVAKEAAATFVPSPASLAARPRPGRLTEALGNLYVCGDWTDCGLPATLEGAARSGVQVARSIG